MRKFILCVVFLAASMAVKAQGYTETFDTNSLGWTECAYKNGIGTAIIDKGVMSIKSKGELKGLGLLAGRKFRDNTFFETHCYAPIDVMKPFEIQANVNIKQLAEDRLVGIVFNYRDGGNFYAFSFNDDFIKFIRFENNAVVGEVMQGIRWITSKIRWSYLGKSINFVLWENTKKI